MNKPSYLPQDIWDTAERLAITGCALSTEPRTTFIAQALLAEREACAQVAQCYPPLDVGYVYTMTAGEAERQAADGIAAAIRNRTSA